MPKKIFNFSNVIASFFLNCDTVSRDPLQLFSFWCGKIIIHEEFLSHIKTIFCFFGTVKNFPKRKTKKTKRFSFSTRANGHKKTTEVHEYTFFPSLLNGSCFIFKQENIFCSRS